MKRVPTEELVTLLVRDLEPTRRIPRLRAQWAALVGVGGLVILLVVAYRGLRPDALALLLSGEAFTLVAAGLLAAALGACAAALAFARPDRDRLAQGGLLCGAGGLALAAGIAALGFAEAPSAAGSAQALHAALACSVSGILFAVPLSILAAFLMSTGAPRRLGMTAAVAALGATAFGALAVHFTCPSLSVWHWITAHALAPVFGAVLLAAPLRVLTLRWERGR
ncbi:MAG TPA: NrsF family protein [Myxococcota bacterium]|nr:NrsF family protein [Myxococcota bacterium]